MSESSSVTKACDCSLSQRKAGRCLMSHVLSKTARQKSEL